MRLTSLDIYETSSHFYIIGTDPAKIKYYVLKLDRNAGQSFLVGEPSHFYTKKDVDELLSTISSSSVVTSKASKSSGNSLLQTMKGAYGILGAVRFLEGYHLIVVSKAKAVALLGHHDIFKIEEVQSVYIPTSSTAMSPDEQKYAKLFQSIDLTTNFYFSYTYDLSRTLQENALAQREQKFNKNKYHRSINAERKFIWNDYLLKPFKDNLITDKWCLEIVHGYIGQQIIELPCTKLALILIGRRSCLFAGTRFLKRGMNAAGNVANDVETEQIVWDMYSTPAIETGQFTSYVQVRGSIPLFWSQDPSTRGSVVGKPPVFVDLVEPHALTTAAHFKELRHKYGYPVSIVNLVKRVGGPKTQDEKTLHAQFLKTIRYLNQFMRPGKRIDYISFDVARCNKSGQVLQRLEHIGSKLILKQGWFQSFKPLRIRNLMKHSSLETFQPHMTEDGEMLLQQGVSRTNCVDCLDRTNVSQFGLGKAALGYQLYAMGYISEPHISTTSELCRVYEDMFDEHGDTMAWQYAGSHLVHSIKTYKKTAAFQERSRDVIQTISRYYSNTFNDYEKQNGINLFLGLFRPYAHAKPHLWDLFTDRYLHFPIKRDQKLSHLEWVDNVNSESEGEEDADWVDWFDEFPQDRELFGAGKPGRSLDSISAVARTPLPTANTMYWRYHKEPEITNFEQVLKEISMQTNKKVISLSDLNQSVFQSTSFMKLWKTPETAPVGDKKGPLGSFTNPEEDEDDDDASTQNEGEDELLYNEDWNPPLLSSRQGSSSPVLSPPPPRFSFNTAGIDTGLRASEDFYGFEYEEPSGADLAKYERYANIARKEKKYLDKLKAGDAIVSPKTTLQLEPVYELAQSIFTVDNVYETEILGATDAATKAYEEYVSLKDNFIPKNNIPDSWDLLLVN